jgi:hypothetical protein
MTGAGGSDPRPSELPSSTHPSRRSLARRAAAPAAATVIAVVAVVAAYLISHTNAPRSPSHLSAATSHTSSTPSPAPAYPTPALGGALSPETGPDGMPWQWIGGTASVELAGARRSWVAFRALSPRVTRTLDFTGPAGEHVAARIGSTAGVHMVGPLGTGRVVLRASPMTASVKGKPPSLSVFLSALRVMPNPVAVLPGDGFWSTESAGGVVFNWLRGTGSIDVYAPGAPSGRVWVTFIARSLGAQRTITVARALTTKRVTVTTTAQPVTVGPFRLVHGRARVQLDPAPGPRRYESDPRPLSVQVASLGGYTTAEA